VTSASLPSTVVAALAERFAVGAVSSCVPITQGLMNPNWRLTTTAGVFAVKQLRDASPAAVRHHHRVLPLLAERGLPVPTARTTRDGDSLTEIDGDWYAMIDWLPGAHRTGLELSLPACRRLGELVGRIHVGLREVLPDAPPALADDPPQVAGADAKLDHFARAAASRRDDFDVFAAAEIAWRRRLLREVGHLRPRTETAVRPAGWTHGDLNGLNLLFTGESVSGILDWDRLGVRTYGLEVVRTATIMFSTGDLRGADLPRISAFVAGYRARIEISDDALRDAAHRRWWTLVCDTWFLRLHYEQRDPSCDHIFRGSGVLLRWWTRHRDDFDAALTAASGPAH
jgi:Ser/Thr protein kinase RdoA (MazF antagonist)